MKNNFRPIYGILALIALGIALNMPAHAQKTAASTIKADSDKIERFFKASGIPYFTGNGIWIVKDEKTDHFFAVGGGYFVGFVTLAEKEKIRVTTESLTEMLKINGEVDSVKISINKDGHIEMGLEAQLRLLDQKEFNNLVNQLVAASALAKERLQPYFVK